MECKHGTHEPCDLCTQEDDEHGREMAIQARIDAAVAAERERCANVLRYWLAGYAPDAMTSYEARCLTQILDGTQAPTKPGS